jgi:hypothetical protein
MSIEEPETTLGFKFQTPFSFADNQSQKRRSKIKFAEEIVLHTQKGAKETPKLKNIMAKCAAVMGPIDFHIITHILCWQPKLKKIQNQVCRRYLMN